MFDCGCMDEDHDKIFVREGRPLKFTTTQNVSGYDLLWALNDAIKAHGGIMLENDENTDFVLVMSMDRQKLKRFQDKYELSFDRKKRRIRVKEIEFVKNSLLEGYMVPETQQAKPGFPAGKARTEFTKEEDENLCKFLAIQCPDGGRMGHLLYDRLVESAKYSRDTSWAKSHPASSWRERYRKNKARLDPIIERYIIELGTREETGSSEDDEDHEDYEEDSEDVPPSERFDYGEQQAPPNGGSDKENSSERGEEDPDDQEALKELRETQQEEDEVDNALQEISHSPIASTSRSHKPQDSASISASRRSASTSIKEPVQNWPPDRSRRRQRLSGVLTAPAAAIVQMRTSLPSGKGTEKAVDENGGEDDDDDDDEDEDDEDDDDDDDETDEVDELEDEEHNQVEEMPYIQDDEQIASDEGNMSQVEEDEDLMVLEPILGDWDADDYRPAHSPPRRSLMRSSSCTTPHNPVSSSGAARNVAAKATPIDDLEVSKVERERVNASTPPPPMTMAERVGQRKKRKDYRQLLKAASPRITRARSRAASAEPPPPQKIVRPSKKRTGKEVEVMTDERHTATKRPRRNQVPVIPEDEVVDEEMGSSNSEHEDVEMEKDRSVQTSDKRRRDKEVEIASDDEQSLRMLGVFPEQSERLSRATRRQVRTVGDVTSSQRQSVQHRSSPRGSRGTRGSEAELSPSSATTVDSFPLEGTRASGIKREHVIKEMGIPYTPPTGTRAARHVQNTRTMARSS
ncbi:hypothetical protein E1B28_009231 [Marasmius oreades]|uniref:Rap1 Myb domain-containing protein n=1 Tax=Marasmius oreades TaxID=181124 RepID=A0A9P7UU38_9AGAR|nr:uncharacterized protein E1B28_009231 [Marasmius oreades]KAG7092926.1 hypothetical protein E1B28_009231 [Marasmius oreades]